MNNTDEKNQVNIFKRGYFAPGILFISALAVRILFFCMRDRLHRDAYRYIDVARDLVAANWNWHDPQIVESLNFPPLLLILNGLMVEIGFSPLVGGGIISILFGALLPLGVYALARQLLQEQRYAVIAALLTIFHPGCVDVSATVMRDPLYLFFFTSALALGINIARTGKSVVWYFLYGIICGLALLSRKEAVELPAIALLWLALETVLVRDIPVGKRLGKAFAGATLMLSAIVLMILPVLLWTGRNILDFCGK